MPSNWTAATADRVRAIEVTLMCPKCGAANRPGATVVEFDPRTWQAFCAVCSHAFAQQADGSAS